MIRRIIGLNLKADKEKKRIFILSIIGILITILQIRLINITNDTTVLAGDIILMTYGGLKVDYNVVRDIFLFILWFTPYIFVLYMINTSVIDRVRESTTLVLPRVKKKYKWLVAFDFAIIIKIILYNLVLFLSTVLVCGVKFGHTAFQNLPLSISGINENLNQYEVILCIFLLNILTLIAIQFFLNNLYYIFAKSNEASVVGIFLLLLPVFYKSKFYRLLLINNGMFRRFEIFNNGFEGLNFLNSVMFISIFIIINFFIGLYIIRHKDIVNI